MCCVPCVSPIWEMDLNNPRIVSTPKPLTSAVVTACHMSLIHSSQVSKLDHNTKLKRRVSCNRDCKCVMKGYTRPAGALWGSPLGLEWGQKGGWRLVMISHHIAHHHHWLIITRGQSHHQTKQSLKFEKK